MNCVMNKFQLAEKRYRDKIKGEKKKEIRLNAKTQKKQNRKLKKN